MAKRFYSIMMEEEFILQCKQDDNSWKCPVMTCGKILSRKQTLKSHIVNQHNVEAGKPVKRYKLYESQLQAETSDIPRATLWRHKKRKKNMISTTDHQVEQVMDTGHTLSDFTAEILTTQSDKVF
ncbi:uncharacterized protein LOC132745022 [Ruditapes philippinarum]|uniref:uncharacterized protein LOC132745022 n=1 Tax=Ruditapes philippinarum TaxID=129788 RepID=UPI00295BE273|nr:uncharacterized protein LOC132745022 [Ruditapes philippinarum]